jgi:two-component system OmpR family response regulator
VIDRMLPGLDGLELIRSVRGMPVKAPILVLTALGEVGDRVDGLRSGADDYLVKPFETAELVARLHALIRRAAGDRPVARSVGDLHIDLLTREARRGQRRIDLKPREFTLLEFLVRHQERVVTRAMILDQVWGFTFDPKTNFIETHISRLRAKLREGDEPELIHTVRGTGYIIREAS